VTGESWFTFFASIAAGILVVLAMVFIGAELLW
jgi:hypothetical protein